MSIADTGITITELVEMLPGVLNELVEEYEDDHKLSADEVLTVLASFADKLQHAADPDAARICGLAELALKFIARFV